MSVFDKLRQAATGAVPDDVKEKMKSVANSLNMRVAIPADYLEGLLVKSKPDNVSDISVTYVEDSLVISGKTTKGLMRIPFKISLKPEQSQGRTLIFMMNRVSPMDLDWINKRIFQMPPTLSYQDRKLYVNLDGIPAVAKVPVGKITSFGVEDGKLWVTLGL